MSQPLQYHHTQPQYVHYMGPPGTAIPSIINGSAGIAPQDTTHHHPPQSQSQPQANTSSPLVATGDWTKDLVHLAKTAELKKHALTLQLHTAHILSAHASLQEKSRIIQDIREQRNKLDSERTRLLNALREVCGQFLVLLVCGEIRNKMTALTDGEYAIAKSDVDRLRQELGQPPLPSLQSILDEKTNQYLNERRLLGNESQNSNNSVSPSISGTKRPSVEVVSMGTDGHSNKRPRGRPKGSKNRTKESGMGASGSPM
ncbi:hypothetical protein J132_11136 [Termitomyces sp. J132]|nr:hypothetical protein J132_11136 [Termitomyces sp. J132]